MKKILNFINDMPLFIAVFAIYFLTALENLIDRIFNKS
jgi:hypothetical protein